MNELLIEVKDYLLRYQDEYATFCSPEEHIVDNTIILIYTTKRAREMYIDVINSITFIRRIIALNLFISSVDYTSNLFIIELELKQIN